MGKAKEVMDKEEATICLKQLTGRDNPFNTLKAMIGAANFSLDDSGIAFTFKMFRQAPICRIELDRGADLYNMVFLKVDKKTWDHKEVFRFDGITCDDLRSCFERTTGLSVSLF